MGRRTVAYLASSREKMPRKPQHWLSCCLSFSLAIWQLPLQALAQTTPPPASNTSSSYSGSSPTAGSITATSAVTTGLLPPDSAIGAATMPAKGMITPQMLATLGNAVTNAQGQTLVIDVSTQTVPGTVTYAGTFNNAGNTYLVSSNPAVTTAVLQAASIYNQQGALLSTILPAGGLAGFSNLVSNLSLSLIATNLIANAGTISSANNLTVVAPQIVNALPVNVAAALPTMSALGNLNIVSPNIINAGMMSSVSNINIASQIANNILLNNVGGVLSALGAINVRDASFAGKYDFSLLGGDVLAKQLNINTGDGILNLQVNNLTPALNVIAGEGYISALSDIHVASLQYSGDPILNSGGDIVFQGDQVPPDSGNYTTICTGGGTFSGTNAYIDTAHPCTLIDTTGFVLNLAGSANLAGASISSGSGVKITAGSGITTGSISAAGGVILTTGSGDISAGTLSASNSFVQVQASSGSISTGSLQASSGVIAVAGKSFTAPSISVNGGSVVDIYVSQSSPIVVGGAGANVGSISLTGTSGGGAFVHIKNSGAGGITLASANAIGINTPFMQPQLALDATTGAINLPAGTISLDSNNFFVPAGIITLAAAQVNGNGTTLSASNLQGGYAGVVAIGTANINSGNGLAIHTDGLFGFTGIGGYGSVVQTSTPSPPLDFLQTSFNGNLPLPVSVQGQSFVATADGYQGNVVFNGSTISFVNGTALLSANGTGFGSAGQVQMLTNQIINQANVQVTANGAYSDMGGFVQVRAGAPGSDLTVGQGKLTVSATGGPDGGDGGQIDLSAGRTLSVDTGSISSGALGGNGWGGRVTLVGGTQGLTGGGVVFTNQNASINANGHGSGDGGLVQIGAFGNGSNLTLPTVSANGGPTGSGGEFDATAGNNLTTNGPISVNAGSSDNGTGGVVSVHAGTGSGVGALTVNADVSANGAGAGTGGYVDMDSYGNVTLNAGKNVTADGGANGSAGAVLLLAGASETIAGNVSASAGATGNGSGGFVELIGGDFAPGTVSISGNVAATGAGNGSGGFVLSQSFGGSLNNSGALNANGGNNGGGGSVLVQAAQDITHSGVLSANGNGAGSAGSVELDAGLGGTGSLTSTGLIMARATGSGSGGDISLYRTGSGAITINNVDAGALGVGNGGSISFGNLSASPLNVNVNGTATTNSVAGTAGDISFTQPGQSINVSGPGVLDGPVSADGSNITLNLGQGSVTPLSVRLLTATGGDIMISLPTNATLRFTDDSEVVATAGATGSGGSMAIVAGGIVYKQAGCCTIKVDNEYHATSTDPSRDQLITEQIIGNTIEVSTTGTANILMKGAGELNAKVAITLKTVGGSIGTDLQPILTKSYEGTNVTLKATCDSCALINIENDGHLTLLQSGPSSFLSAGPQQFTLFNNGNLTLASTLLTPTLQAQTVTITTRGDLTIQGGISAGNSINLTTLLSSSGASDSIKIQGELSARNDILVNARGDVLVGAKISAGSFLTPFTGNVDVISSEGLISSNGSGNVVTAQNGVRLEGRNGVGQVVEILPGVSLFVPIETDTAVLQASSKNGNVVIHNRGPVYISLGSSPQLFHIENTTGSGRASALGANPDLSIATTISADVISLSTSGNGSINLIGSLTGINGRASAVNLTTTGTGNIFGSLTSGVQIRSGSLTLKSEYGSIANTVTLPDPNGGTVSSFVPLLVDTITLKADTGVLFNSDGTVNKGGVVFLANTSLSKLTILDSSGGLGFSVSTVGPMSASGSISTAGILHLANAIGPLEIQPSAKLFSIGFVSISTALGPMVVHSGASIGAVQGDIMLNSSGAVVLGDPGNSTQTFITAASTTTFGGNIFITTQGGSGTLSPAISRSNFTILNIGGLVLWGPGEVAVTGGGNTAVAINRFIVLDSASQSFPIVLNGNVHLGAIGGSSGPGASGFAPGRSSQYNPNFGNLVPPGPPNFSQPPGANNPGQTNTSPPGAQLNAQGNPGQKKKAMADVEQAVLVATSDDFQPVSFVFPMSVPRLQQASFLKTSLRSSRLWCSTGARLFSDSDSKHLKLEKGDMLVQAIDSLTIEVSSCRVELAAGAIVLVSVEDDSIEILNLHDCKRNSVKCFNGQAPAFAIAPGQELMSRRSGHLRLGRRLHQVSGSCSLSEFSVYSLIQNNQVLKEVVRASKQSNPEERLVSRVLKTAACISIVCDKHGNFRESSPTYRKFQ